MNSRCTSQQPGGAGSSKPSESFITSIIAGYSIAESVGLSILPSDFEWEHVLPNFWRHFLKSSLSNSSKNRMQKSRKTRKRWREQGLGRRPQDS